jgi:hypothetical protein
MIMMSFIRVETLIKDILIGLRPIERIISHAHTVLA